MEEQIYKFNSSVKEFSIDTVASDIQILESDVEVPTVEYFGDFEFKEGISSEISEVFSKNKNSCRLGNINTFGGSIIISGSSNFVINGVNYSSNGSNLRLIIPKNYPTLSFDLKTTSGDIRIDSLTLSKLFINSTSGDLTLCDMDVLKANIKTISGDVDVNINNCKCNYDVFVSTISGDKEIISVNDYEEEAMNKSELRIKTTSGDIKVLFKRKRA